MQDYSKARGNRHLNQVQAIIPLDSTLFVIEEHSFYINMLKLVVTNGQAAKVKKENFEEVVSRNTPKLSTSTALERPVWPLLWAIALSTR